nr:PREDICTED: centrosomal protein of 126 kDa [Anolis carolinensis]|eukprot:XP_016847464.1 PREDICTED: centrosomal protein of 126 kDa [Anolis carolinensis]
MEPGGGGGGSGSDPSSGSERPAETWRRGREGEGLRKGLSESAVPRGLGRRAWAAFFPSSGPNLKVLLERDLSKERHELLKDQRLFHTQARKLSVETNKRRRALEEKWKEDEQKEQKFREQILLQRKQKHQEATERFQRSHLPSSQRKSGGGVQGKTEPKLDEALQKIQATGFFPFRVTERPSSATRNDRFNWKQNSPNVRCDRIMQENRRGNLNSGQLLFQQNLDEMQQQLQEQHFSNLQDFHQEVNEITRSESVSSVDSLEAGERNESCATLSETSSLSAQLDSSCTNHRITNILMKKDVEHVNTEETLLEEASEGSSDQQKSNGKEKVNENILFLPQGDLLVNLSDFDQQKTDHTGERKGVKFPKSILKKESKYEPGCFKAVVVNRGIKFGGQSVSDARDSIELAKIKGKDADIPKNNKKLRWFDEINRVVEGNDDEKCSEQSITEIFQPQVQSPGIQIKATASKTNIKSVPFYMLSSVFPETHQNSQISNQTTGGSNRDNVIQSNFGSSGYHVAKQAWMAPRGEEIRSALHNCDSKNPKNNPRKGRTKTIKRPKSAKSQSTTSVIKNRRGTIIRPQSASEAPKVMKAQGKIIVPHPPCKAIPDKGLDESPADVVYQSVSPCKLQTDTENSNFSNGRSFLPEGQDVSRNNTGDALPSTNAYRTHAATMRPSYSVFTYGPLTKTKVITNAAPSIVRSNSFPKRTPVYSENVLHLDRIPTDEEITVLWQGVHHALAQKDVTAGDSQHNSTNGDVPPTRPNVSHITIDGGILSGNIKSSFRSNAIFASKPSTSVAFARRKQMNENNEYKRKALLEQRRQMTASARQKATGVGQNIAPVVKKVQSQLAYEPIQSNSNEVSDSTTQFLLAENLANLSATESEILSGLDVAQAHKQTVVLNRPPRQGMSALSFEEHQVLQSLDRLNQRLQNVQETINKNPSSTSVMQTISPLIASPSYMDLIHPMQRYKSVTDATHTLKQKKF